MRRLLPFILAVFCSAALSAEIMETAPGCRILHVSELNYPPSTTLAELLELFPELLAREDDTRLENYDIQVGGISTGSSREAVLLQLHVSDIEDIAVSQSPDMTRQQNGQGGVVSITLKDATEGISGGAALKVGTLLNVTPVAEVNYREGAILVRSSLMMDYRHPFHDTSILEREYDTPPGMIQNDTTKMDSGYEHARVTVSWTPDTLNCLNVWMWQSYTGESRETDRMTQTPMRFRSVSHDSTGKLSFTGGASYSHVFPLGCLSTQLEYCYSPYNTAYDSKVLPGISTMECSGDLNSHSINGLANWKTSLLPEDGASTLHLTAGLNYRFSWNRAQYDEVIGGLSDRSLDSRVKTLYLSPYAEARGRFGSLSVNGGVRFQSQRMSIKSGDTKYRYSGFDLASNYYDHVSGDCTAFINLGWAMAPRHSLSISFDRSISRPSSSQLYPDKLYDPGIGAYVKGNAELRPVSLHNAILSYGYDDSRNWVATGSVQYINARDILCSYYSEQCMYWKNDGKADILAANAMMYWRCGILNLSLSGNLFQNRTTLMGSSGEYFHYNFSLVPMLCLRRGFRISPKLVYNSHIYTLDSRLGDYFFAKLGISKTWKKLTLSVDVEDIFHRSAEDSYFYPSFVDTKTYNLHSLNLSLSAHYCF